jgi:phosphate transport system permease protein
VAKRQFVRVVFEGDSVSAPPSKWEILSDQAFRGVTWFCTLAIILLLFFILFQIGKEALPAMGKYGPNFLISQTWDANKAKFGILPQIWGTLYSLSITNN